MSLTEHQLKIRRLGITSTDAPAIVGLSEYRTAADVWLSKKHPEAVSEPSEKQLEGMAWGNRLEQAIADHYAQKNGVTLLKVGTAAHPAVKWLLATPDRLIKNKKMGLELKNVSEWQKRQWGPSGTDLIPRDFLIQVMHCMMVFGFKMWDVACLIGGRDYRVYRIYADKELQAMLYKQEKRFYEDFIIGTKEPNFDSGEQIRKYVLSKYPEHDNSKIINIDIYGDAEAKEAIKALCAAKQQKKKCATQEEDKKTFLMNFMQDAAELHWEEESVKISWRRPKDSVKILWDSIAKAALEKTTLSVEEIAALKSANTLTKENTRRFVVSDEGAEDCE
jgi:putative phage-type endonuclease